MLRTVSEHGGFRFLPRQCGLFLARSCQGAAAFGAGLVLEHVHEKVLAAVGAARPYRADEAARDEQRKRGDEREIVHGAALLAEEGTENADDEASEQQAERSIFRSFKFHLTYPLVIFSIIIAYIPESANKIFPCGFSLQLPARGLLAADDEEREQEIKKQPLEGLSEKATRSVNFSEPLWGCHYHAPIGLTQTSGIAGDFYFKTYSFSLSALLRRNF